MTDELELKDGRPVFAMSTGNMDWNRTGSWRYMRPLYQNKMPPCTQGCPARERIPQYFALVKEKRYEEAWHVILDSNPLPGVCGRVCYHPCETACNREDFDRAISINCMERFVADQNFDNHFPDRFRVPSNGKKVAIIGSGPGGLSAAYFLARTGYSVTIYEAKSKPGGMLRLGIPKFRLPRAVVDKEIGDIQSLGVTILTDMAVGDKVSWEELKQGHDAVLIATGAYENRSPGVPGTDLEGVTTGLKFLEMNNTGSSPTVGKRLMVVGGGNTAIDTARTAKRLGAEPTIVYRRSREEMPAVPEEIEEAEREGIPIHFLTNPVAFIGTQRVEKVRLIAMELGPPDESGRRRPVPIPGSETEQEVDQVMLAIGEKPDLAFLPKTITTKWDRVEIDGCQVTNEKGVFACGDAASGPNGTVVDAIATGKNAAKMIDKFLNGLPLHQSEPKSKVVGFDRLNLDYFTQAPRPKKQQLPLEEGAQGFAEINLGITEQDAQAEADRCFSCGVCTYCDTCLVFCPDVAISRKSDGPGYDINYDFCKGCGICVEECPRCAMVFEEELKWNDQ